MKPLVSVIMPVYNAEKYIKESIEALLNQTYSNFEIIVIDDCGIDNSIELVKKYADNRFKFIHNKINCGIAYSRNIGLKNSRGKYVAILDDDDISMPKRLAAQVDFLENNKDIDVLGGESIWIDGYGQVIRGQIAIPKDPDYIKTSFLFGNMYNNSEVMFRKSLIDEYNISYEDSLLGMEDFKFWIECSKIGKFSNLDELLLKRRMAGDNTTAKILRDNIRARKMVFADLQAYSLMKSGFAVSHHDMEMINKFINEEKKYQIYDTEEIYLFHGILNKLVNQAEELDFGDMEQIKACIKDIFIQCF